MFVADSNGILISDGTATQPAGIALQTNFVTISSLITFLKGSTPSLIPTPVKTANYAAHPGDFVPVSVVSGNVAITLPSAPPDGSRIGVKVVIGGTGICTVLTSGADVYNKAGGGTTATLSLTNQGIIIQYAAGPKIWYVIDDDLPLSQLSTVFLPLAGGTMAGSISLGGNPLLDGGLVYGGGLAAIDLPNRMLIDATGSDPSVDWANRQLKDANGDVIVDWSSIGGRIYDVVAFYNASGSGAQTMGQIGIGSHTLTLDAHLDFKNGQGIAIAGAGDVRIFLITTILSGAGTTTLTLADPATHDVITGTVLHDDTLAVNTAYAAAYNAGGGRLFFRNGQYCFSAAYNGTTNSILTVPQNLGYYQLPPPRVEMIGEARGTLDSSSNYVGGVVLDFRNAPTGSGTEPSAWAGAPFSTTSISGGPGGVPGPFNQLDPFFDNMLWLLPRNSTLNGINMGNCTKGSLGDTFQIQAGGYSGSFLTWVSAPTHPTTGIIFPQALNNVYPIGAGQSAVLGFITG